MNDIKKVHPFDSLKKLYKVLTWIGFYKLTKAPKYKIQIYLHHVYRSFAFVVVFLYNVQHLIYIVQIFDDKDQAFETLAIEISQLNLLMKLVAVNSQISKLDNIRTLIKDPMLAPISEEDENIIRQHHAEFRRLLKVLYFGVTLCFVTWILTPILDWIQNNSAVVANYYPFDINSAARFSLAILFEQGPIMWIGYGHITLDMLIACLYSQATVQLKIIRNNLPAVFNSDKYTEPMYKSGRYVDEVDTKVVENFLYCIKRYEKVMWLIKEVTSVFDNAISFQFFTTSNILCLVIYRMSTETAVAAFIFLTGYFVILQFQIFLFCYYGELVRHESSFIKDAIYLSEWQSLSPKLRRQVVRAMMRWTEPVSPRVSIIIPLSLTTFITIIRAAFNLFTVLKTTNSVNIAK